MRDIGKNIRTLRIRRGLTQDELAEALFVTRQTVSNYETGRSRPDVEMLLKIAKVLEADILHLLYGLPVMVWGGKAPILVLLGGLLWYLGVPDQRLPCEGEQLRKIRPRVVGAEICRLATGAGAACAARVDVGIDPYAQCCRFVRRGGCPHPPAVHRFPPRPSERTAPCRGGLNIRPRHLQHRWCLPGRIYNAPLHPESMVRCNAGAIRPRVDQRSTPTNIHRTHTKMLPSMAEGSIFDAVLRLEACLGEVEVCVHSAQRHELFVRALLLDFAVFNDQNSGGIADGGEAVGDNQGGSALG